MPEIEYDPISLMMLLMYNAIVLGMSIKWFLPEVRKIWRELVE